MRKVSLFLIVCIVSLSVYADNSARIKELVGENIKLDKEITQINDALVQRRVKIIANNAVIAELQKQDEETKEEVVIEVPKDIPDNVEEVEATPAKKEE